MTERILQNQAALGQFNNVDSRDTSVLLNGKRHSRFTNAIRRITDRLIAIYKRQNEEARIQQAISHLRSLTDEQLRDMGITRMDIARVVRYGKD